MKLLALASALVLAACAAPDLSTVAGDYSRAVDNGATAVSDTVRGNTAARKALGYQQIALDRPALFLDPACNEIVTLAGWTGGAIASPDAAPAEEARTKALTARQDRLKELAKDCAVTTRELQGTGATSLGPESRDPFYLCGIAPSRLDVAAPGANQGVVPAPASRIPPPAPAIAAQTELMPALASYAAALKQAAEAQDIAEIEAAGQKLVASFAAVAALAGPYGVAAAPVVTAVGTAANSLAGAYFRQKRFNLIKNVVVATDPVVQDSAAIVCHSALLLSYEIVRAQKVQVDDQLTNYNAVLRESAETFQDDAAVVSALNEIDRSVVSLRDVGSANYVAAILGIAAAHHELKIAVENPKPDFAATYAQLNELAGQFEDIKKATAGLTSS